MVQLVLLAGGRSRRMGTDKLQMTDTDGVSLVGRWLAELDQTIAPAIVLPPGRAVPAGLSVGAVVHDTVEGEGPLRGVLSAIDALPAAWLLFVPVDMPGVGRTQLDWLQEMRERHPDATAFLTRRPAGNETAIEPFPLLLSRALRPAIERRLREGRRSLHGLASEPGVKLLDAPADWPASVWANLNRPEDLAEHLSARRGATSPPPPPDTDR